MEILLYVFRKVDARHMWKNVNIESGARFSPRCEIGNNSGIGVNAHYTLVKM